MNRRAGLIHQQMNQTRVNIKPIAVISSAATDPTATSPIDLVITLSEISTDFAIGDITVSNGSAGTFAGSGKDYTVKITPTGAGLVTVYVNENVFTNSHGDKNRIGNIFTIRYAP